MHGEINVIWGLLVLHMFFGHSSDGEKGWLDILQFTAGLTLLVLGLVDYVPYIISTFGGG